MEVITIELAHTRMTVYQGKKPKSRIMWRAAGLEVYVIGKMDDADWQRAANIAMNACIERHIPVVSLRKADRGGNK